MSDDTPRCPVDGRPLICPTCRAREIGRKGGLAKTETKKKAAKRTMRRREEREKRSATLRRRWDEIRGQAIPAALVSSEPLRTAGTIANPHEFDVRKPVTEKIAELCAEHRDQPAELVREIDVRDPGQPASVAAEIMHKVFDPALYYRDQLADPGPAARPEPAGELAGPGASVGPDAKRSALTEALAKRRGGG